ncbi:MAG: oligosaccharyl transferase subunit ost3/OST6, partial [Watsoniomyces obsoletus]
MLSRRTFAALTHNALYGENTIPWTRCLNCEKKNSYIQRSKPNAVERRQLRYSSSSSSASSKRWQNRQGRDYFAREARVQGLKSRAAFKLLEINEKHKIFKKGQTVIDLGYAPGSWSEVAVNRTAPTGRVIGIDIIPAKPPQGASAIQGNFLSASVQAEIKHMLSDPQRGRPRQQRFFSDEDSVSENETNEGGSLTEEELEESERGYIDLERHAS